MPVSVVTCADVGTDRRYIILLNYNCCAVVHKTPAGCDEQQLYIETTSGTVLTVHVRYQRTIETPIRDT